MKRIIYKGDLPNPIEEQFILEIKKEKKMEIGVFIYFNNKQIGLIECENPKNLIESLINSKVEKIVYSGFYNSNLAQILWNIKIQNIFSLEIASIFSRTYNNNHSREKIYEEIFSQSISKKTGNFNTNGYWDNEFKILPFYLQIKNYLIKILFNEKRTFIIDKMEEIIDGLVFLNKIRKFNILNLK